MGHPIGSLEDKDADRNADNKGPAHVIQKQIKDSTGDWARKPFILSFCQRIWLWGYQNDSAGKGPAKSLVV